VLGLTGSIGMGKSAVSGRFVRTPLWRTHISGSVAFYYV
jgi:dephospho-CoA kinase